MGFGSVRALLVLLVSHVWSENMDWGPHPDLVDEANKIQGRENNKRMVVMQGDDIKLECRVTFTSDPPNKIIWKIDGQIQNNIKPQTEEPKNADVHIKGHITLPNISKSMDGKTVSCEYSKGMYGESIVVFLRVFTVAIKLSEDACVACKGTVELVFKESERESPAESTVDERIKAKIEKLTKTKQDEIQVDNFGYSVTALAEEILTNPSILKMKPTLTKDGLSIAANQCDCVSLKASANTAGMTIVFVLLGVIGITIFMVVVVVLVVKKSKANQNQNQNPEPDSTKLSCL